MTTPERRQTARKTLEKQAYINIEPNNVGIVLNVSAGGLCFHSIDPVKHNGPVRFGLSGQQQRIEAEGVLVWSDETQKGGLRFTSLSAAARDRMRDLLGQPATPLRPVVPAAQSPRDANPAADNPAPFVVASPERRQGMQLTGFSRGLATGLLVSVFVTGGFIFHGYRREFGEWLIRTGERFAAKPQPQSVAIATPPPTVSPAPQPVAAEPSGVSPAPRVVSLPTQKVVPAPKTASIPSSSAKVLRAEQVRPQPKPIAPQPPANSVSPQLAKLGPAEPTVAAPTPPSNPAPKADVPGASTPDASGPATRLSLATPVPITSNLVSAKLDTTPKQELASQPAIRTEESKTADAFSTSEVFFEVGKFKNPLQAHDEADKVARLGFPVTAVQKGFLWTSSYHILVGPYGDEERAKTTHDTLVSDGFKPRTFERGSRSLTLASTLSTDGGRAPEGEYVISWESYIGNASVKFLRNNFLVATASAKWVKRDVKYPRDAYVYRRNPDGSRTLLEIHFEGMRQALVFGKSS